MTLALRIWLTALFCGVDLGRTLVRPDERLTVNALHPFRTVTAVSSSAEQRDIAPCSDRTENILSVDLGYFRTRRDEFHVAYTRLDLDQRHGAHVSTAPPSSPAPSHVVEYVIKALGPGAVAKPGAYQLSSGGITPLDLLALAVSVSAKGGSKSIILRNRPPLYGLRHRATGSHSLQQTAGFHGPSDERAFC